MRQPLGYTVSNAIMLIIAGMMVREHEALRRQRAAQALHTIPDPMTARERAEREAESGEMS